MSVVQRQINSKIVHELYGCSLMPPFQSADDSTKRINVSGRDIVFDLSYSIGSERARALYDKSVRSQWQIDSEVDWKQPIDPSAALQRDNAQQLFTHPLFSRIGAEQRETFLAYHAAEQLSQLLHGEQGAMLVASNLVTLLPDQEGKLFAAAQTMDEARHVDVFTRYINRLGKVSSPNLTISRILDKILMAPTWQSQLVGMQIIVEGLAMSMFKDMRTRASCPVLTSLLPAIMRDEARHMGFGTISLRPVIEEMSDDERAELEDFALDLVLTYRNWGSLAEDWIGLITALIQSNIDPSDFIAGLADQLQANQLQFLQKNTARALDRLIIPSLACLGLIPDRHLDKYEINKIPQIELEILLEDIKSLSVSC